MRYIILVFVITILWSCDPFYTVRLNGEKTYMLDSCGGVKVFCKGLTGMSFFINVAPLKDDISFNPADAFESLVSVNSNIDFNEIRFFLGSDEIIGDTISIVNPNEALTIKLIAPIERGEILIPPGNYLMCNNTQIITDTIRIKKSLLN